MLFLFLAACNVASASVATDTISLLREYPDSFITRSGSKLQIEGHTIRLAGANIYWLGLDENGSPGIAYPTSFRVQDAISTAVDTLGATVIRAHTLGISVGQRVSASRTRSTRSPRRASSTSTTPSPWPSSTTYVW